MNPWSRHSDEVGPITRLSRGVHSDASGFLEDLGVLLREREREGLDPGLGDEFTAALVANAERLGVTRQELVQHYTGILQGTALERLKNRELPLPFLKTVNALGGGIPDYVSRAFSAPTLDAIVSSLPGALTELGRPLETAVACLAYFEYGEEDASRRDAALVNAAQPIIDSYLHDRGFMEGALMQAVKIVAQRAVPDPATIDALVERSLFFMARGSIEFGANVLECFDAGAHADKIYRALVEAVFSPRYYHPSSWSSIGALILKLRKTADMPPHIAAVIRAGVRQYTHDVFTDRSDAEALLSQRAGMAGEEDDERSSVLLESIITEQLPLAGVHFIPTRPITAYSNIFGQLRDDLSAAVGKAVQRILYLGNMESAYTLALSAAGRPESIEPAPFREALSHRRYRILGARDRSVSERLYDLREHASFLTRFETGFSGRLDYGLAEEITATARAVTVPNARHDLLQLQYLRILAQEWVRAKGTRVSEAITDQALRTALGRAFQEGLAAVAAFDEQRMSRSLKYGIRISIEEAQEAFGYTAAKPNTSPATVPRGAHHTGTQAGQAEAQAPQAPQLTLAVYIGSRRIPAGSEEKYAAGVISGLAGKVQTPPTTSQRSVRGINGSEEVTLYGIVVAQEDARVVLTRPDLQSAVRAVYVTGPKPSVASLKLEATPVDGGHIVHERRWNALARYQLDGFVRMLTGAGAQASAQPAGGGRADYHSPRREPLHRR